MSSACSVAADWTLSTEPVLPAQRRIECLPAKPVTEWHLAGLLAADAVVEVWLPLQQRRLDGTAPDASDRPIRDMWIEFADRLHAVRYEHPGGGCPVAWYRALHPIKSGPNVTMATDPLTKYTRLSDRAAANGA